MKRNGDIEDGRVPSIKTMLTGDDFVCNIIKLGNNGIVNSSLMLFSIIYIYIRCEMKMTSNSILLSILDSAPTAAEG